VAMWKHYEPGRAAEYGDKQKNYFVIVNSRAAKIEKSELVKSKSIKKRS
jgi:hypothetical protein